MGKYHAREPKRTGTRGAVATRPARLFCLAGPAFLLLLFALVVPGKLPWPVLYLYLGSSLASFLLYGADKWAARENRGRVRERTLHILGLLGGWPGGMLAQRLFHHKSQKSSFLFLFRLTVLVNCVMLALVICAAVGRS